MKTSNWAKITKKYSRIKETRRETVFAVIHDRLKKLKPQNLLDYGAGDGKFATMCSDLPIKTIVNYDTAFNQTSLVKKNISFFPHIKTVYLTKNIPSRKFDIVTFNAVWMCLSTNALCLKTLKDINRLLKIDGYLIASVTHPCFRNYAFLSHIAKFDMKNYLQNGIRFKVKIFDNSRKIEIVDTHWNLSAMSNHLRKTGFVIDEIVEIPDKYKHRYSSVGSPWMIVFAKKQRSL